MRALVTGGAGLIGSHIADLLYSKGYKIRILDNLEKETHLGKPDWIKKDYEFIRGDVKNKKVVEVALKGVDYVFHQAAYGGFSPQITKFVYANCVGTANIFEVIKEKNYKRIKKVIVASSQAVYGEGAYNCITHGQIEPDPRLIPQLEKKQWELKCPFCKKNIRPIPTNENKRIDPRIIYSITKYSQERITIRIGQQLGIPTVALRYALTYGPRQSLINPYTGIASIFSTRILNGVRPTIYEDGQQTRDFTYVEDTARANFIVSQFDKANYEVFNVSTCTPTTVLKFVDILNSAYKTSVKPIIPGKFRPGEVRHLFLDNSKLKSLGWKPSFTLEQGIAKYVSWIKSQGDLKEYFTKSIALTK